MSSFLFISAIFCSNVAARQVPFSKQAVDRLTRRARLETELTVPMPATRNDMDVSPCSQERAFTVQPESLAHSNLGGMGPTFSANRELLFGDVFPGLGGCTVDLQVEVVGGASYFPGGTQVNGEQNGHISISLQRGSQVELQFTFIDRSTKSPRMVPPFWLSALFWNSLDGKGVQSVWAKGFTSSILSENSTVSVVSYKNWTQFSAIVAAIEETTPPQASLEIFPRRDDHMVSLLYPSTSSFNLVLLAPNVGKSTTFYFSGQSSLSCGGQRAQCSADVCPAFYKLKESGDHVYCAGAQCTLEDVTTCCDPVEVDECKQENILWFSEGALLWSNLMGFGPDNGAEGNSVFPHSIMYGDVLPYSGKTIDLEVTANPKYSNYLPADASKNGMNGLYANINVRGGHDVNLTLRFLERDSGTIVNVGPYFLSVVDFDQQGNGGGQEVLKVPKGTKVMTSPSTVVDVMETDSAIELSSTVKGTSKDNPVSPMNLTQSQKDKSATLRIPAGSNFTFALSSSKGWAGAGRNILFTGPSSLLCPPRALCDTFDCPLGHRLRSGAQNSLCHGSVCTDLDLHTCCEEDVLIDCSEGSDFSLSLAAILHSNLGGQGPDHGDEGLVYGNVFPFSDWVIDLHVNSLLTYKANNVFDNGIKGAYGKISIKSGSDATLKFSFVNRTSGELARMPNYLLSFLDFDSYNDGRSSEKITVSDFAKYFITPKSQMLVLGLNTFGSSMKGTLADNPTHPLALTDEQKNKSITFFFNGNSAFLVNMSVATGADGRNITFSGASNLVCPTRAPCSTLKCPAGHTLVTEADNTVCSSDVCNAKDVHTCCSQVPPPNCDDESVLDFTTIVHSNLGGQGPDFAANPSLLFTNVFPHSHSVVDLRVTNLSVYRPTNSQWNGLNGKFAQVDINGGSAVVLNFEFVNRSSGGLALIPHDVLVSVFNLHQRDGRGVEVTPQGYHTFFTSQLSDVTINGSSFYSMSGWADFPVHPRALSSTQMNQTATFLFPSSSSFVLSATAIGSENVQLILAGASNLVCSPQALCSSYSCPPGFMAKRGSAHEACAGGTCTHVDNDRCCVALPPLGCERENFFKLEESSVIFSNLHGSGPDTHRPEAIVYGNVFPHMGIVVDMTVTASHFYVPHDSSKNGLNGRVGSLNVRCGSGAKLIFSFTERGSNASFTPPPFYFSIFDFDMQLSGGGRESITFNDFVGFKHVQDGPVTYGGDGRWSSNAHRHESDNPIVPMHLDEEQRNKSVTFLLSGRSSFTLQVDVEDGWRDRNILFGGPSNLVCSEPAQCFSFTCPEGYRHVEDTSRDCSGSVCTEAEDLSVCCEAEPEAPCEGKGYLHLHGGALVHSNLGGLGPHYLQSDAMVFSDVFPNQGSIVDLEISNLTEYRAHDTQKNHMHGDFAQINVKCGAEVVLEFKFVNRSSGKLANMVPFMLSFFDFDLRAPGWGVESLTVGGYHNFSLTPTTKVAVNNSTFTATEHGIGSDNAQHALALEQGQLDKAVTFLMKEEPVFTVTFGATRCETGRNILFGGPSSLRCPMRALCSSYHCPSGWKSREDSAFIRCAAANCTEQDLATCCLEVDTCIETANMQFGPDSLVYSNLGGHGPDYGKPQQIYFADVFPSTGKTIDFLIAADDMYQPNDATMNGLFGQYANLNIKTGSRCALNLTLIDRVTGSQAGLNDFQLTIFDFDEQRHGGANEIVRVPAHEVLKYTLSKNSAVIVEPQDKYLMFSSTAYGNAADNPTHPMNLTESQKDKSIALLYGSSRLTMEVEVTPGHKGRNLVFAGSSSLTCAPKAACSTMQCPSGFDTKEDSQFIMCGGKECTRADLTSCCVELEQPACGDTDLNAADFTVADNNLGGYGPTSGEPMLRLLFPSKGLMAIVEVASGTYEPLNATQNGKNGAFLGISMKTGTDAVFRVSFFDATTGLPYIVPDSFYLTFFDLDQGGQGEVGSVGVFNSEVSSWTTSPNSNVQVLPGTNKTLFHSIGSGVTREKPTGPRTLDRVQKDNLVSVMYKPANRLHFTAEAVGGQGGRTILIGGSSTLTCSPQAPCASLTCPRGFVQKGSGFCAGRECGNQDLSTCCEWSSEPQ